MTRCRGILVVGALILASVDVWALAQPVTAARGRDEIDYLHLQLVPLAPGETLTQLVQAQRDGLSSLAIPYRWRHQRAAAAKIQVQRLDGTPVADAIHRLGRTIDWSFERVPVPNAAAQAVLLRITRMDSSGELDLFASPPSPGRPTLAQNPKIALAVQTQYGESRPALMKASLYAARVGSLAPPWLPRPLPELLVGVFLFGGIGMVAFIARGEPPPPQPPVPIIKGRKVERVPWHQPSPS